MAPMGIVTAITSAIRVCGDSSLRAFIGRAQEGDGVIEAELCTSTSRDVCELFHKGGITRVFGKPQILEIIQICKAGSKEKELHLFREHLRGLPEDGEWVADEIKPPLLPKFKQWLLSSHGPSDPPPPLVPPVLDNIPDLEGQAEPKKDDQSSSSTHLSTPMVQNPNLSLNVGIEKLPNWAFVLVAAVGLFLQAGVIAMAGILTWWLEWSPDRAPENLVGIQTAFSNNKYPLAFMIGTILLSSGMFWCAALVGEITDEKSYRRREDWKPRPRSQIFWLQPGGQEVGGETFDAFAYFGEEKRKIEAYTTSTKIKAEKFHVYTWIAVVITLGGYVAQFIGLRGMNAAVSIAQLGATLFMSFLRGCLRMRRLGQTDNKLKNMPDMVAGHELDWLTFKLADEELQEHVHASDSDPCLWIVTAQSSDELPNNNEQENHSGETLLRFRTRLALLTGHDPSTSQKKQDSIQNWNDEQVAVRSAAKRVARAISDAADEILGRSLNQHHKSLRIGNLVLCSDSPKYRGGGLIYVNIDPPGETATGGWAVSSARLEGILGLWLWSLKKAEHFQEDDEHSNKRSTAEQIPIARIFPSFGNGDKVASSEFMQGELDLWLGPTVVKLRSGTLRWESGAPVYNSLTAWRCNADEFWKPEEWRPLEKNNATHEAWRRFFGLRAILPRPRNNSPAANNGKLTTQSVLFTSTQDSLLSVCSQELYSVLLASLAEFAPESAFGEVTITQTSGQSRLEHSKVEAIVTSFMRHNLGSRSDAILSIIPSIRDNLKSPKAGDLFSSLMHLALRPSDSLNENVAETLLRWVYHHSFKKTEGTPPQRTEGNKFAIGLMALGEIYRSALSSTHKDNRKLAYQRIRLLVETYDLSRHCEDGNIGRILDRYQDVAAQIAKDNNEIVHVQEWAAAPWAEPDVPKDFELVSLIRDGRRTKSIYLLCKMTTASLTSGLEAALPSAAGQKWPEVTMALLNLGALVDGQDHDGRTALSHWAEYGDKSMVSMLLERDAFPDLPDKNQRTPLWWAARRSDREIIKLLRNTGKVEIDSVDENGRSPFSIAAEFDNKEVVRMLRDTGLVALDRKDNNDRTPFSYAAEKGSFSVIDELVSDSRRVDPDAQDLDGRTPLSWAVGNGMLDVVVLLLQKSTARTDAADSEKRTPIFWAVQGRKPEVLSELLANLKSDPEEKVNAKDLYGQTPLMRAARLGYDAMIEELCKSPDLHLDAMDDMKRTAIWWALRNGHLATAKKIPIKQADFVSLADGKDAAGRTPLWYAARDGNDDLAKFLLDQHADANAADLAGYTPLLWAARNGHENIVRWLLEVGHAQADTRDEMGHTPLSWAARSGQDTVVRILLGTENVCLDSRDNDGRTPLSWAAGRGHVKAVEALVESQAFVNSRDFDGRTPREWAKENSHQAILDILPL